MSQNQTNLFIRLGIINLCIVAAFGVLMRYKIGFEFPYFNQRYLLHAHSHFAFAGWVSHILFTLMVVFLQYQGIKTAPFSRLIWANLLCAYGMIISFAIQGYGAISITFSTLSILVSYVFSYLFFIKLREVPDDHPSKNWFKASLLFNVLSSLGTFYLAYMMASKHINQHGYLASVYFYLHFQYSGWFFFGIMGLLMSKLLELPTFRYDPKIFIGFFTACIPAYFLSVLWAKLPLYLYFFPVAAVILQLWGLQRFLYLLKSQYEIIKSHWSSYVKLLLGLSLMSLIIKLALQAGSIFPEISKLAYGFRSIVIAYLHLVLLGLTTLFLMGYMLLSGYIPHIKKALWALVLFCIGVFANELVLMVQGVASFGYILIPYLNEILLGVSLFMLLSLMLLLFSFKKS